MDTFLLYSRDYTAPAILRKFWAMPDNPRALKIGYYDAAGFWTTRFACPCVNYADRNAPEGVDYVLRYKRPGWTSFGEMPLAEYLERGLAA